MCEFFLWNFMSRVVWNGNFAVDGKFIRDTATLKSTARTMKNMAAVVMDEEDNVDALVSSSRFGLGGGADIPSSRPSPVLVSRTIIQALYDSEGRPEQRWVTPHAELWSWPRRCREEPPWSTVRTDATSPRHRTNPFVQRSPRWYPRRQLRSQ